MRDATTRKDKHRHSRRVAKSTSCVFAALTVFSLSPAQASTVAGTTIPNVANATFEQEGGHVSIPSNTAQTQVAEILDAAITAPTPLSAIDTKLSVVGVPFLVGNPGNGSEAYALTAKVDQAGVSVAGIAIDSDGDGLYDPTKDALLSEATTPALAPGQQQRIFVLVANAPAANGDITVTAATLAVSGSGAPGTVFAGKGNDGVDAIVGKTGAAATTTAVLTAVLTIPTLAKTQSVSAPDGTDRAVRGATITYQLRAHFTGRAHGVTIDDPLPAGTSYVAHSLALDGQTLTDAADADAGAFDGTGIHVSLGDIIAAGDRTVTFKTIIQ